MADEEDEQRALVNEIEGALEVENEEAAEAGDEMDAIDDKKPPRTLEELDDQQEPVSEIKPCGIHELVVNPGEDMIKIFENFYRQYYKHQIIDIVSVSGTATKVGFEVCDKSQRQYEGEVFELDDGSISLVDSEDCKEDWEMHTRITSKSDGRAITGVLGVRGSLIAVSPIYMCLSACEKKTDDQTDQQTEMDPNNAVDTD